jgi:hypothetical protein
VGFVSDQNAYKSGNYFMLSEGGKKEKEEKKEEKKGRKRREKGRKGEKKGNKRKGKGGKREYEDSVGGCVGRFFFQSPEVGHKLGCQPEFVATGDLKKKMVPRSLLSSFLFSPEKMHRLNSYTTHTHTPQTS